MATMRETTNVELDSELVKALRAVAERTGRRDYEVLEEAARMYLSGESLDSARHALQNLMDTVGNRAPMSDQDALELAYSELHAARRERTA
jgi:predicted transcriptional regulator